MGAKVVVAEDAGGMAVVEIDLDGVAADLGGGIRAGFRFEHGEKRRGGKVTLGHGFFFGAFVVAGGAGADVAEVGKIVVAGMAVGPGDVDTGPGFDVDLDGGRFFALVEGCGHKRVISLSFARAFEKSRLSGVPARLARAWWRISAGEVVGVTELELRAGQASLFLVAVVVAAEFESNTDVGLFVVVEAGAREA